MLYFCLFLNFELPKIINSKSSLLLDSLSNANSINLNPFLLSSVPLEETNKNNFLSFGKSKIFLANNLSIGFHTDKLRLQFIFFIL